MSLVYDNSCSGKTMVYKCKLCTNVHSLFKQGRESLENDQRPSGMSMEVAMLELISKVLTMLRQSTRRNSRSI